MAAEAARYCSAMPGHDPADSRGDAPRGSSLNRRGRPRLKHDGDTAQLGDRLRKAVLKPVDPGSAGASGEQPSVEELEADVHSADDKERLIGLLAAPFAAAIGILVISALIENDPPTLLGNGRADTLHVSLSLYHALGGVLLGLSVLMLATAMLRKRLYLGIAMALYGLAIFNLHYWGFGIPFIMGGAWLLVRAYRLQRDLREATEGELSRPGPRAPGGASRTTSRPQSPERYRPRATAPKRSSRPKPRKRQRAR